jgi:hypothetical protein
MRIRRQLQLNGMIKVTASMTGSAKRRRFRFILWMLIVAMTTAGCFLVFELNWIHQRPVKLV